mmetsp:Transcript_28710/g.66216  ORF Transcript_28710/g.66216 Transcript_28710/m.66216 type:complete len:246 (-) Transcript_28710:1156-1893(-)
MSPRLCGMVVRSVSTSPSSASKTTPAPRYDRTSASIMLPSIRRSISRCCTVLKRTEQIVLSSAHMALLCIEERRLFSGGIVGVATSSGLARVAGGDGGGKVVDAVLRPRSISSSEVELHESNFAVGHWISIAAGILSRSATICLDDHRLDGLSNVQTVVVKNCLCILTMLSCRCRPFASLGTIQTTVKYSLSAMRAMAFSKAVMSEQGVPLISKMTASDFTDSPKTNPACATYTPCTGMKCFIAV